MAALAMLTLTACADLSSTRDVRMTILDPDGKPVPGTIFYAEARQPGEEPFAYFSYRAGPSGAVPDQAREAAKIGWQPGAEVAMAAFAPGYRPAIALPGARPSVPLEGGILTLEPGSEAHPDLDELRGLRGQPAPALVHLSPPMRPLLRARLEASRAGAPLPHRSAPDSTPSPRP